MNTYSSYKDSGIEWIGEIPSGWRIEKLKYIGNLYGGLTGKSGKDFNNEDNPYNKPFIPFTNIFNNVYISSNHFQYVNIKPDERQNRVIKNDLFFLMSSEGYEDLGKSSILISEIDELYLNSFCKGYRVNTDDVNPLFVNYQLLGNTHRKLISIEGKGFTRINLRQDKLKNTYMFIPPLQEQQQIVDYLDKKTSKIDKLIEKTEQKIELLKEQRTSLINTTVTKGLDPNVEMKDSGVEWIGDIPSGWNITRLINLGVFSKGKGIVKDDIKTEGHPCVRGGEVYTQYDRIFNKTVSYISDETVDKSILFKYKSILFAGDGETLEDIGKCIVYNGSEDIYIGGGINVFTPIDTVNHIFLSYLLNSDYVVFQKSREGRGQIIVHIYQKQLREIRLSIPPHQEQQQIVDYLDSETSKIDKLVDIESKRIILLKEYRQSLISEVVTGKVDIRDEVLM